MSLPETREPGAGLPAAVRRVAQALARAGLAEEAAAIRRLHASTHTAKQAARALGCELGAIASSLVFVADGRAILVMTSGRHRVDTGLLAARLGVTHLRMAAPDEVHDATGQEVGGVSPVGHPTPVPTYVDAALADYDPLWAAAGTAHAVFPISFARLLQVTSATAVDVAPR